MTLGWFERMISQGWGLILKEFKRHRYTLTLQSRALSLCFLPRVVILVPSEPSKRPAMLGSRPMVPSPAAREKKINQSHYSYTIMVECCVRHREECSSCRLYSPTGRPATSSTRYAAVEIGVNSQLIWLSDYESTRPSFIFISAIRRPYFARNTGKKYQKKKKLAGKKNITRVKKKHIWRCSNRLTTVLASCANLCAYLAISLCSSSNLELSILNNMHNNFSLF